MTTKTTKKRKMWATKVIHISTNKYLCKSAYFYTKGRFMVVKWKTFGKLSTFPQPKRLDFLILAFFGLSSLNFLNYLL